MRRFWQLKSKNKDGLITNAEWLGLLFERVRWFQRVRWQRSFQLVGAVRSDVPGPAHGLSRELQGWGIVRAGALQPTIADLNHIFPKGDSYPVNALFRTNPWCKEAIALVLEAKGVTTSFEVPNPVGCSN